MRFHPKPSLIVPYSRCFVGTYHRILNRILKCPHDFRADFLGRGCDEALFSEKGGGNSVNPGFGKDLYRKGNSVKRFGPFTEPPDSEN